MSPRTRSTSPAHHQLPLLDDAEITPVSSVAAVREDALPSLLTQPIPVQDHSGRPVGRSSLVRPGRSVRQQILMVVATAIGGTAVALIIAGITYAALAS